MLPITTVHHTVLYAPARQLSSPSAVTNTPEPAPTGLRSIEDSLSTRPVRSGQVHVRTKLDNEHDPHPKNAPPLVVVSNNA
jgi:hypothetical protein